MEQRGRLAQGVLGVVGALGIYLTWLHYTGGIAACPARPLANCTRVLTSGGSVVLGVPLPVWGVLWAGIGCLRFPRAACWLWIGFGAAGLAWAWGHEWALRTFCLWCSGMQVGILGAMGLRWPKRAVPWGAVR